MIAARLKKLLGRIGNRLDITRILSSGRRKWWLTGSIAFIALIVIGLVVAGGDCNSDENGSIYAVESGVANDPYEIAASNEPDATLWDRLS